MAFIRGRDLHSMVSVMPLDTSQAGALSHPVVIERAGHRHAQTACPADNQQDFGQSRDAGRAGRSITAEQIELAGAGFPPSLPYILQDQSSDGSDGRPADLF